MPYKNRSDLPKSVNSALSQVPKAQDIYKEAYNSAYKQYASPGKRRSGQSREETAHAVAWNAVKSKYERGNDGKWHPKK